MSQWPSYEAHYRALTLRTHGDKVEQFGCAAHNLDGRFPNYQEFWRIHVAPATDRPSTTGLLAGVSPRMRLVIQISYSIFRNLVDACDNLALVKARNFGGDTLRHVGDTVKYAGDAIQKATDLEKAVSQLPGTAVPIIPNHRKADFLDARENIVSYRNYMDHQGVPPVAEVTAADGTTTPYLLKRSIVVRSNSVLWDSYKFTANPADWSPVDQVCAEVVDAAIGWLNEDYSFLLTALAPRLGTLQLENDFGWAPTKGPGHAPTAVSGSLNLCATSGTQPAAVVTHVV